MIRRAGDWIGRHPVLAFFIVFAIFPFVVPYKALATQVLIYGLLALGFNLLYGYTGLLSFGHAAYWGLGAYGTGIALAKLKVGSLWLALGAGVGLALLGGAFVGFFARRRLRLRRHQGQAPLVRLLGDDRGPSRCAGCAAAHRRAGRVALLDDVGAGRDHDPARRRRYVLRPLRGRGHLAPARGPDRHRHRIVAPHHRRHFHGLRAVPAPGDLGNTAGRSLWPTRCLASSRPQHGWRARRWRRAPPGTIATASIPSRAGATSIASGCSPSGSPPPTAAKASTWPPTSPSSGRWPAAAPTPR